MKNTNKLPLYFCIKREADNPLWDKYIQWVNETYNMCLDGTNDCYYGFDNLSRCALSYHKNLKRFNNKPTIITLEQWDNIVNKTQNNMKTQTLTLGQLKDLYHKDNSLEWKKRLIEYLTVYSIRKDNDLIEIDQRDIDYAKQRCSLQQLKLLTDAGLKFEEECPYKVGDWVTYDAVKFEEWNTNFFNETKTLQIHSITDGLAVFEYEDELFRRDFKWLRKATQEEIKYAQIDWNKLKTGSVVMFNCNVNCIHEGKPVKIVLYNTNYTIGKIEGFNQGKKGELYTTVFYNHYYVSILEENFRSFVSEVISY